MTPSIADTALSLALDVVSYRLDCKAIDPEDARSDAAELFGAWRLAFRLGAGGPRLDILNRLHNRLDDAARRREDLKAVYQTEINNLKEQTT
ncbi:MAG: hypothetical protein EOM91_24010 [Sphingobacteriia bacterium]|nr:hypothetical protein [Sphingobacteriia bacterium]